MFYQFRHCPQPGIGKFSGYLEEEEKHFNKRNTYECVYLFTLSSLPTPSFNKLLVFNSK